MIYRAYAKYTYYDDDDIPHDEFHDIEIEAESPKKAFDSAVKEVSEKYSGFTNRLNVLEIISLKEAESGKSFKISKDGQKVTC